MFTSPPICQLSTYYLVTIVSPVLVSLAPRDTAIVYDLTSISAEDTACNGLSHSRSNQFASSSSFRGSFVCSEFSRGSAE